MRDSHWLVGAFLALVAALVPGVAAADGCYICRTGSSAACRNYCHYSGTDNAAARHACEQRGCVIGGTAACPTSANRVICSIERPDPAVLACSSSGPNCRL